MDKLSSLVVLVVIILFGIIIIQNDIILFRYTKGDNTGKVYRVVATGFTLIMIGLIIWYIVSTFFI